MTLLGRAIPYWSSITTERKRKNMRCLVKLLATWLFLSQSQRQLSSVNLNFMVPLRVINLTAEFDATWPVDGFAKKMTFPGSNLNMLGE